MTEWHDANKVVSMAKKLYIIDGHAHIYAAYYAPMRQRLTSPSGEPTKAVYIFSQMLVGLIQRQKPDMLIVAMDSKAPTFRSEIYPDYKAHRPPMPEDMPKQIDRIEQILNAMNIPILRLDGYEADDIIGTITKRAVSDGYDSLICSKDKDLLQLIDEHISLFDVKTDTVMDEKAMIEKVGVRPEQFIDCLALQGDTADNVPGVPDVGPKTAIDWIKKYGSIKNLYEHIDEIKSKRGDNLLEFKDQAMMSRELVTIKIDVPIEIDYKKYELHGFDDAKLTEVFNELGFNRLLTQLGLESGTSPEPEKLKGNTNEKTSVEKNYQLIDTEETYEKFLSELKKHKLFAVDTETTSVDSMKAELVGMSFSWEPYHAYYLAIKAPLGTKHLDINVVRKTMAPILADSDIKKIGQNIKYDMLVLQNAKMPVKGVYFDTMVASYCLNPERSHSMDNMARDFLGYECIPISSLIGKGKNQLTFDMVDTVRPVNIQQRTRISLFACIYISRKNWKLNRTLQRLFEEVEMPLVPVLAAMEYNGVSLDIDYVQKNVQ